MTERQAPYTVSTNPPRHIDIIYDSVVSLTQAEEAVICQAIKMLLEIMRRKRHTIFLARWDYDAGKFKFYEAAPV